MPVLTLRQHISVYKLELKYIQTKTTKRWLPAWNLAIKAQHITMQTNCMIWEILFSDIDLNIFKNKRKNAMPRYRKKKYFMDWYSLKLHSDVFLFEQLHCNTTNFHTMNNQIHYNSCVYGEKIINIRGIVMLCFTTIHHHCPPSVKDLRSRFTLLLTIILSEDRHLLDNTIR
jgi:hypothetical protein